MTFAVGIALFAVSGYYIRPWRSLATAANSPGVLLFLLCVYVQSPALEIQWAVKIFVKKN